MSEAEYDLGEIADLAGKVEESPEYYAMLDYRLEVQATPIGVGTGPETPIEIPIGESEIAVAYDGRVTEVQTDDWYLFIETDHRGAEHGVDAWLGEPPDPTPALTVHSVSLESEVSDE